MSHSHSKSSAHKSTSPGYNPRATFTYVPLNHPRHFRLLHLTSPFREQPADWKDTVLRGTLVETSLDEVPEYFALSYAWGNPSLNNVIFIEEQALKITRSCAVALRRMLKGKIKITIWVDAICINQTGNTQAFEERGTQVAFMDEIYSKAIQVNIYLGERDEETEVAIKAVRDLAAASVAALEAKRTGVGKYAMRKLYDKVAEEVLQYSTEFPFGKLDPLFRLPWFRRLWIFQEVILARKVVFYCGEHMCSFEYLIYAVDFTLVPYSRLDATALYWKKYLFGHDWTTRRLRLQVQGEDAKFYSMNLLIITATLDATRPEDKIYGLHGCAKKLGLNWPTPNYTKSVAQIYTEATVTCFQQSNNLGIMDMAIGPATGDLQLLSWVPDFSGCLTAFSLSQPPKLYRASPQNN